MLRILRNKEISFDFNPFGGLSDAELEEVVVPKFELADLMKLILNGQPKIVEFVGNKGRGKTTHLKLLQQKLSQYPLFLLNSKPNFAEVFNNESAIIFIDSIHHFNLFQRIKLFRLKKTIILTTHSGRFLEYKLARKQHFRFDFKGIEVTVLKTILKNRMQVASGNTETYFEIKEEELADLIKKFGDDYRAILNYLYDEFQTM